eukprot:15469941-Alexandrium_andersonii.AAC.1
MIQLQKFLRAQRRGRGRGWGDLSIRIGLLAQAPPRGGRPSLFVLSLLALGGHTFQAMAKVKQVAAGRGENARSHGRKEIRRGMGPRRITRLGGPTAPSPRGVGTELSQSESPKSQKARHGNRTASLWGEGGTPAKLGVRGGGGKLNRRGGPPVHQSRDGEIAPVFRAHATSALA